MNGPPRARAHGAPATPGGADGATWKSIARRLYALVVGAVVVSFLLAILGAQLLAPPPPPWLLRSAARQLERVLDDRALLEVEVKRFADESGYAVAVYDNDKRLVFASTQVAPELPTDFRAEMLDDPMTAPDMHPPGAGPPFGEMPKKPPFPPRGMQSLVLQLTSPTGATYAAVFQRPSGWPALAVLLSSVLLALAAIAISVARVLSRPLAELVRAADAFGRGDVDTRVDLAKAGAFGAVARAFNEMATRVAAARRAERDLLANVSHELRTPLSRIRVALELAGERDTKAARATLSGIGADLAEVETMIQDIFTAARLERGGAVAPFLRREPESIEPLLAAAGHRFRSAHPRHTLHSRTEGASGVVVQHDATLLRRAVDNLLDNAAKYSNAGSVVELECTTEDAAVVIRVRDRGIGISADDQSQLFTPFFRADKSRTRDSGGVGLGLVLVKRIIEAHEGTVSIDSTLGEGTTATLRLSSV